MTDFTIKVKQEAKLKKDYEEKFKTYFNKHGVYYDKFIKETGCSIKDCELLYKNYMKDYSNSIKKDYLRSNLTVISYLSRIGDSYICKTENNRWVELSLEDDNLPILLKKKELYLRQQLSLTNDLYNDLYDSKKILNKEFFEVEENKDVKELTNEVIELKKDLTSLLKEFSDLNLDILELKLEIIDIIHEKI
ncbi:hypothetical protein HERIO_1831 [Hepatospora eriocheir]|uniref:Uncharacterized protein n=1 Tax=Hepatospora eriocheir TaxID=1081669 RepID=A0A1X0Q8V6_9MICR|nr:hypothetical protein HERIO_1831 [Hepatospora eriocheir]